MHAGPYHTQYAQMLPQFTESEPLDINEHLNLHTTSDPNEWRIEFETHPENRPEELAHLQMVDEVDPEAHIPVPLRAPRQFTNPKTNLFMTQAAKSDWKSRYMRNYRNYLKSRQQH